MSAKSTCLVLDMKCLYKHIPEAGDNLIKTGEKKKCVQFSKIFKLAPQRKMLAQTSVT